MPGALRHGAAAIGNAIPGAWLEALPKHAAGKLPKLFAALQADDPVSLYTSVVSRWRSPHGLVLGASEPEPTYANGFADFREWMMYTDAITYLPDDILAKLDRAAMAISLETRVPYLDPEVVELAWSLPIAFRAHAGEPKRALRRLLHRYVPRELVERPKAGFAIPLAGWLRGELRGWAEALLEPARLAREGLLDPAPVRHAWETHAAGRGDHAERLWNVLMFQAWHEQARAP
jgi:asparagine synthase (glutamine-hydrolysing)